MNFSPCIRLMAGVLAVCLTGGGLHAQDETDNNASSGTTNDSTGLVIALSGASTISVKSEEGPFTYVFAPDVFVFKANNKPGSISDVRVGQMVTVYYYKRIGQETVGRVVILKPAKAAK